MIQFTLKKTEHTSDAVVLSEYGWGDAKELFSSEMDKLIDREIERRLNIVFSEDGATGYLAISVFGEHRPSALVVDVNLAIDDSSVVAEAQTTLRELLIDAADCARLNGDEEVILMAAALRAIADEIAPNV